MISATEVVERTGVTYRMLDYWVRCGAVTPAVPAAGSGTRREFTEEQVDHVRELGVLMRWGLSLPAAKAILRDIQSTGSADLEGGFRITRIIRFDA